MNNYNSPSYRTSLANSNSNANSIDADTLEVLGQISNEVGAGLTKTQLAAAMNLLRLGVNPSALVAITQELRKEAGQSTASAAISSNAAGNDMYGGPSFGRQTRFSSANQPMY
ncbi:hypothetical protein GGI07_002018 [Coemansia sp. Benny D115]|nr:hypothetical protein GGI07_002018 [Coemansia sp. Benny D115]